MLWYHIFINALHFYSLISGIGKPAGLSVDFESKRLYWIDGGSLSIEYLLLDSGSVKTPISVTKLSKLSSGQPIALFLFKNYVFWADAEKGTVERANKENGLDHLIIQVKNYMLSILRLVLTLHCLTEWLGGPVRHSCLPQTPKK